MRILLRHIFRLSGFDHAVSWTVAGRVLNSSAGPVSLWIIGSRLSSEEQGLYYLFADLMALKVLVELGVSYVLMQITSHEGVRLDAFGRLQGDERGLCRTGSLLRLASGYYAVAAAIIALSLSLLGTWFIRRHAHLQEDAWVVPWIGMVVFQSAAMGIVPFLSILEGMGAVASIARFRLVENALFYAVSWSMMLAGKGLYAVFVGAVASFLWILLWISIAHRESLLALWRRHGTGFSWKKEVWPFQWRIAISWVFGYFIFQLFTPVVFALDGAKEAGRIGMSMAVTSAVLATGLAWIITKAPRFGQMAAEKEWEKMDVLFFSSLWRGGLVVALGGLAAVGLGPGLRMMGSPLADRILGTPAMAMLAVATAATYVIVAAATYLRAHKCEPFLVNAGVNALLIAAGVPLAVHWCGASGACGVYCAVQWMVTLPWAAYLFFHLRKKWHTPRETPSEEGAG